MSAGRFNQRVVIEQRSRDQDEAGQPVDVWKKIPNGDRWAWIRGANGAGAIATMQSNVPAAVERCSIRLPYCEDVTDKMRAVHRGRIFDIKNVLPDYADRQHVDLVCEVGGRQP